MTSKKLVFGVGINDADYYTQKKKVINLGGLVIPAWVCPFYAQWKHMLERGYCPKFLKKNPTYVGVTLQKEWLVFSNFRSWMLTQDWEGKQLDKDILYLGNKVYSEHTCIFVHQKLNKFFNQNGNIRGDYPIGVTYEVSSGRYVSRCCNVITGIRKTIGRYGTPQDAHIAWYNYKMALAVEICYTDLVDDPRLPEAIIKIVESMKDK